MLQQKAEGHFVFMKCFVIWRQLPTSPYDQSEKDWIALKSVKSSSYGFFPETLPRIASQDEKAHRDQHVFGGLKGNLQFLSVSY